MSILEKIKNIKSIFDAYTNSYYDGVNIDSIERNRIIAFVSCFVIGLVAHSYLMFNQIFNGDGVFVPYGMSTVLAFGRWLGVILNNFFNINLKCFLSINSFNILLGVILLSLCSAQIVEILNIKKAHVAALIAALMVVQPAIINIMGFSFVFHLDMFALLLATYAAKLILVKNKIIIPAILIGCSAGIYQAYIQFALGIIFIHYFLYILDGKNIKLLFISSIKYIIIFALGMAIYSLGLKYTIIAFSRILPDELSFGYAGISSNGLPTDTIANLFNNIIRTYEAFVDIYTGRFGHITNFPIMRLALILVALTFIVSIFNIMHKLYKQNKLNFFIAIFMILIIPIVTNMQLLYYKENHARVHTCLFFIFYIPLLLLDRIKVNNNIFEFIKNSDSAKFGWTFKFNKILTNTVIFLFLFITVHFTFVSNGEHYRLYLFHKKYERSIQNVANLIISNKDYKDGMEIMMYGTYKTPKVYMNYKFMNPFNIHAVIDDSRFAFDYSYSFAFLQLSNLNIYLQVPSEDREKYKDIPNYPNPDCVQKIDDNLLLIKFSD